MSYAFDGNTTNMGTYVNYLTTYGPPVFTNAVSRAGSNEAVVYFDNAQNATKMSSSYYKASTYYGAPLTVIAWLRCDLSYSMTVLTLGNVSSARAFSTYFMGFEIGVTIRGQVVAKLASTQAPSRWTVTLSSPAKAVSANEWFHVGLTISASYRCVLYVNGHAVASGTSSGNLPGYGALLIGANGRGGDFRGYMANLQMYNAVLSANQTLALALLDNLSPPTGQPSSRPSIQISNSAISFAAATRTAFGYNTWSGLAISSNGQYQTLTSSTLGFIYRSNDTGRSFSLVGVRDRWGVVAVSGTGQYQAAAHQFCLNWVGGCQSGYIYRSTDYGLTWAPVAFAYYWNQLSIDSSGKYQVACAYADHSGAVILSSNYGSTWTGITPAGGQYWVSAAGSHNGYITAHRDDSAITYTSSNWGQSWTMLPDSGVNTVVMSDSGQYQVLYSGRTGPLLVSRNYGRSFSTVGAPSGSVSFATISSDGGYIFALAGGTVYVSRDHGLTFAPSGMTGVAKLAASGNGAYVLYLGNNGFIYQSYPLPTSQPSSQPSQQPSVNPTRQPSTQPSVHPSSQPFKRPSSQPSSHPLSLPSTQPSTQPSSRPSPRPFSQPSCQPSSQPLSCPSSKPSGTPSMKPYSQPTMIPTMQPSNRPSLSPSHSPSGQPSSKPLSWPSRRPSSQPTLMPSSQPIVLPSFQPIRVPSSQPTLRPSSVPSRLPSMQPSALPSQQPACNPSGKPSDSPSRQPWSLPSSPPSQNPVPCPSINPSSQPTTQPSSLPTRQPSQKPSAQPHSRPSLQPSCQPTSRPSQPSSIPTMLPNGYSPTPLPSVQPTIGCGLGQFVRFLNASRPVGCINCPIGTYSNRVNARTCKEAPPGAFVSSMGASTYSMCPIGTYNPGLNATSILSCLACPNGRITPLAGSITDRDCLSPLPNFISAFLTLVLSLFLIIAYAIVGRFHRIGFLRRFRTLMPIVKECRGIIMKLSVFLFDHPLVLESSPLRPITKIAILILFSGLLVGLLLLFYYLAFLIQG
jgi:Tyrosine-protein kinase ephrin type A/B receptor-like